MSEARRPVLIVEDDPALQVQMKWAFDAYEVAVASNRGGDRPVAARRARRRHSRSRDYRPTPTG